ncbi:diguanylate cyclase [Clostridium sp.]|uniref:diguanylate cyclase n=1 Tax=Clostridium sp. TaxID=1506 RepID=UPI00283E19EF|nr:diguanylate cyclase [Clostridium sp.]MDR3593273.1 diguanylate cyclase [Clostridium sp.]
MILNLFLNACILITFISVAHIFLKDKDINNNNLSLTLKIITGVSCGILGIILMIYSVYVTSNIIIDFRYVPILLAAMYGGFLPAIIASICIGAFRVWHFGVSQPSIAAFIAALIIGIGFSIICRFKLSRKSKWIFSIIYLFFLFIITFIIVLGVSITFFETTAIYCIGNIVVSCIVFFYAENLIEFAKLNKKFKHEATKDFITGLNNVRQFDTSFNNISQLALRKGENLSLLFIDIDLFKKINDTYGHNAGDIVLKGLAEILIDTVRVFDIVSRNGGEEFSIILLDCSSSHAMEIAERLRKKVETHEFNISDKVNLSITISIGVSTYPDTTNEINDLLEYADKALYEAKRTGRNKVVLYKDYNHQN